MSNDVSFFEMLEKTELYIKKNKDSLKNLNSVDSLIEYVFPLIRKLKNDIDSDIDDIANIIDSEEVADEDIKEIAISLIDYVMSTNMLIDILMIESGFVEIKENDQSVKELAFTDKFNKNEKVKYLYSEISKRQEDEMENLKILSGDLYASENDTEDKDQTDTEEKLNNPENSSENTEDQ